MPPWLAARSLNWMKENVSDVFHAGYLSSFNNSWSSHLSRYSDSSRDQSRWQLSSGSSWTRTELAQQHHGRRLIQIHVWIRVELDQHKNLNQRRIFAPWTWSCWFHSWFWPRSQRANLRTKRRVPFIHKFDATTQKNRFQFQLKLLKSTDLFTSFCFKNAFIDF